MRRWRPRLLALCLLFGLYLCCTLFRSHCFAIHWFHTVQNFIFLLFFKCRNWLLHNRGYAWSETTLARLWSLQLVLLTELVKVWIRIWYFVTVTLVFQCCSMVRVARSIFNHIFTQQLLLLNGLRQDWRALLQVWTDTDEFCDDFTFCELTARKKFFEN